MTPTRLMTYAIPADPRSDLGRRRRTFRLDLLADSLISWRPPLVALPVFEGHADSTLLLLPRVREMANDIENTRTQRLFIGLPLLVLLLFAHWALPRMIGVTQSAGAATGAAQLDDDDEVAPAKASKIAPKTQAKHSAAPRLLSVTEAPPRTPGDITKDGAI